VGGQTKKKGGSKAGDHGDRSNLGIRWPKSERIRKGANQSNLSKKRESAERETSLEKVARTGRVSRDNVSSWRKTENQHRPFTLMRFRAKKILQLKKVSRRKIIPEWGKMKSLLNNVANQEGCCLD